jgi:hypothetical protein
MKKATLFLVLAMTLSWALISCSKSESEPEPQTDPRDAWVGNYTETFTGSMVINIPGMPMTIPISDTGSFRIEKGPATNRIVRVDADTMMTYGTINGNQVNFDPRTETSDSMGMVSTITATGSGILNGKVINYTMNLNGSASMSGILIPITGSVAGVATKK